MNTIDTLQLTSRVSEYVDLWTQLFSQSLSNLLCLDVTAEPVPAEKSPGPSRRENETGIWIGLAANGAVGQTFFLTSSDALQLTQLLGGKPHNQDGALGPDGRKAIEGFVNQIAAKIPTIDWLGSDAELKIFESKCPEWESAVNTAFRFSTKQDSLMVLHTQISAEFASTLQSVQETANSEKMVNPAISPHHFRTERERPRDNRLELLMDVELEVVLRFGQREMLLHDVLNLTPGTVLELDQKVQDPVELLVGNRIVAWGEVVTIDGNYGLRITSLASRKERLESLRK